jgi:spore cortex formation protein SpoVR/YcgB (stage V sporulation)
MTDNSPKPGTPHTDLSPELLAHMQAIKAKAIEYKLDFLEVVYEVLPFEMMNQIAAFGGVPVRYPHWRWGMEYEKLSKRDAYGLGRISGEVIGLCGGRVDRAPLPRLSTPRRRAP